MSQIAADTAGSFAEGFFQLIAGFASGTAGFGNVAGLLLTTVCNMAIRLGKLAISIGIAIKGIKTALKSLNPVVAIAAGVALIALGTLAKSAAANIGGGGDAGAFASGGIVGGSSYYGDKLFARVNSGEAIFNQEQQKRLYGLIESSSNDAIVVGGTIEASGDKLQVILNRANKSKSRRT